MRWLLPLFVLGCDAGTPERPKPDDTDDTDTDTDEPTGPVDADNDGVNAKFDCNDDDPDVSPKHLEACDGKDNDCDDEIDEGATITVYPDVDQDDYGDESAGFESCVLPEGHVIVGDDCDDADDTIGPTATELCDGIDNDCNGSVDEPAADDAIRWYKDDDGDGYGLDVFWVMSCHDQTSNGFSLEPGDCDDTRDWVHPGADELCDGEDTDCDSQTGEAGLASFADAFLRWSPASSGTFTEAGDLHLCPGTHTLDVTVDGVKVEIQGGGIASTFLDGTHTLAVTGGGTLELRDLAITGGDRALDCANATAELTRVEVSGQSGRAVVSTGCDVSIADSRLVGITGGAIDSDGELVLEDSEVSGNSVDGDGAGLRLTGGTATCIGSSGSPNAGFWDNTATGSGSAVAVSGGGELVLQTCDLGMGSFDNPGDDLWFASGPLGVELDDDESATCSSAGCTP